MCYTVIPRIVHIDAQIIVVCTSRVQYTNVVLLRVVSVQDAWFFFHGKEFLFRFAWFGLVCVY